MKCQVSNHDHHLQPSVRQIQDAVTQRKETFLATDTWSAALDNWTGKSPVQAVYYRLMRLMALWPTLVRNHSQIQLGDSTLDPKMALAQTRHVLKSLAVIERDMNNAVWRQGRLSSTPSHSTSLVSMSLKVRDPLAAMLFCHFATYSVIVHRIALSIMKTMTSNGVVEEQFNSMIGSQCRRIWMLLEYAQFAKPLGLPIMPAALLVTFETANNANARAEIISALNELQRGRVGSIPWTAGRAGQATALLLGK